MLRAARVGAVLRGCFAMLNMTLRGKFRDTSRYRDKIFLTLLGSSVVLRRGRWLQHECACKDSQA